jgi:dienelactone hydrolase
VTAPAEVGGFARADVPDGTPWPVYRRGDGPPVVLLHEVFGVTATVLQFGRHLADSGFTVWLPALAGPVPSQGKLGQLRTVAAICVSREIHVFATGRTSPVVEPLRALARHAATVAGTRGAGVVGMCLTGGFALAMAADENVLAAVASQPSLPYASRVTPWCARDLGLSPADVDCLVARLASGATEVYVTRFSADRISPAARLATLTATLGDTGVTIDPIPSEKGNAFGFDPHEHAVLTVAPTRYLTGATHDRLAETSERVIAFLHRRLGS